MSDSKCGFFHFCKKSEMWYCVAASAVAGALGAVVAAHFVKPKICEPKKTKKKFHLKYWNGRGLMEVPRTMLALKGVEYDDGRYTTDPPYDNVKSRDEIVDTLDCNLGRMPVLTVDDSVHIGQSNAINYYVATELGMMGSSNEEAAQIICIREHLLELQNAKGWQYFDKPTEEQLVAFFEGGPASTSGVPDGQQRAKRALPFYLGRLEQLVGTEGFAVGAEFSLADALIYNVFGETLKDSEAHEKVPQFRRVPFGDAARMNKALAAHPNVRRIVDNYRANISAYLDNRDEQRF